MQRLRAAASHHLLGALGAGVVVFVFCLLLLRHDPSFFWTDDYQISILPVFTDIARSWSEGHWPLLSPYSWICGNLAGEFQYGTFSVFINAVVILIWKLPLSFAQQAAALSMTQLFALAMGAYLLARGRDLSVPISLMVALVAALNGWIVCWGATDWFGALAAFVWLPWSWWAMEKAVRPDGPRWRILLPAPFLYLLVTGGFPYTVGMIGLVTAWLVLRERNWRATRYLTSGWLLGLGLAAPAWLSLMEYAPGSRRSVEIFLPRQWLVPWQALPGLLLPSWTVHWRLFDEKLTAHSAIELACGLAPIVILLGTVCSKPKRTLSKLRWEIGLLAIALMLCLLPSPGVFRFSFRWLALFHLVLALTAAEAYRTWNETVVRRASLWRGNPGAWAVVLTALTWLATWLFGFTTTKTSVYFPLVTFACAIIWWIGAAFFETRGKSWLVPLVTFATLLATYLELNPHAPVAHYFFTENLRSPVPLDPNRLYLSLYPAPQAWYRDDMTGMACGNVIRPGSTSMFAGVHLVNGYSPVGPAGVSRLFDTNTHGHLKVEKVKEVVIPEAATGGLLEMMGIDGIIVARDFELPAPLPNEWKLAYTEWEGDVYHRAEALAPVRALTDATHGGAKIDVIENTRQRVIANILPDGESGPVRVAYSRPYFPGYHAKLKGKDLPVTSLQGLIPTVELPSGASGRLELTYLPRAVLWGSCVSALSALVLLVSWRRLS